MKQQMTESEQERLEGLLETINDMRKKGMSDDDHEFVNLAFSNGWVRWGVGDCRGLQVADDCTDGRATACCDPQHS